MSNAFTINRLGSAFFPLSLTLRQHGDVSSAFLCAQRVIDMCDVLEKYALPNLLLFGVGQTSLYEEATELPFALARIAAEAHIPHFALDAETLIVRTAVLRSLLAAFAHYELFALDLGANWTETTAISQVLTCQEHAWSAPEPLLAKLPAATTLLASHDDCYLTVQTRQPVFIRQLFTRTLQIYAGTVLAELAGTAPLAVAEIPAAVLAPFWRDNLELTILRAATETSASGLRMGVSLKAFSFRDALEYPPAFWLRYDVRSERWFSEA
jgi:hypothetical protein